MEKFDKTDNSMKIKLVEEFMDYCLKAKNTLDILYNEELHNDFEVYESFYDTAVELSSSIDHEIYCKYYEGKLYLILKCYDKALSCFNDSLMQLEKSGKTFTMNNYEKGLITKEELEMYEKDKNFITENINKFKKTLGKD